jgi:hypothetical protein
VKTAADLRAEAERMRQFALTVTDPDVLETVEMLIAELECRARKLEQDG